MEKDAGTPEEMDALRNKAGKPTLPVWFVAFGDGRTWADDIATTAADHRNMGVTYSSDGEYGNAADVRPAPSTSASASNPAVLALRDAGPLKREPPR